MQSDNAIFFLSALATGDIHGRRTGHCIYRWTEQPLTDHCARASGERPVAVPAERFTRQVQGGNETPKTPMSGTIMESLFLFSVFFVPRELIGFSDFSIAAASDSFFFFFIFISSLTLVSRCVLSSSSSPSRSADAIPRGSRPGGE